MQTLCHGPLSQDLKVLYVAMLKTHLCPKKNAEWSSSLPGTEKPPSTFSKHLMKDVNTKVSLNLLSDSDNLIKFGTSAYPSAN